VVIPLNKRSILEISTSAAHALEILSGDTVLPAKQAKVIGLDGQPMTKRDLLRIRDSET
jgi:hypothetical protein